MILIGSNAPLDPMRSSMISAPIVDSVPSGNHPVAGRPIRMWVSGQVREPATTNPKVMAFHGCRESHRAQPSQAVGLWYQASRRASQLGQSIVRPRMARLAGRSVTASATATVTTNKPPIPTDLVSMIGVISRVANPTITVSPLVTTARPAVNIVLVAASFGLWPRFISSRNLVTISSE